MNQPRIYEIKKLPDEAPFLYKIVNFRTARKEHACKVCPDPIVKGEHYCEITDGGSGLGGIKFPDRTHECCLERYMEKEREKWKSH